MFIDFREGEGREREQNIDVRENPLICAPTRYRTHNLVMWPDQELKLQPFSLHDNASTNWATPAGVRLMYF